MIKKTIPWAKNLLLAIVCEKIKIWNKKGKIGALIPDCSCESQPKRKIHFFVNPIQK